MEMKEAERVIVAKPVASKPTCSNYRSFSELLAGALNVSPSNVSSENTVAAIRPKTVRFKPMMSPSHAPLASVSSQADVSEISKSDSKPTIYKPQAKLVSMKTVSLLANMGNFTASQQHNTPEVRVQPSNQDSTPNYQLNIPSSAQKEEDPKSYSADRPSYDGYNWRKYGQKQVKGSEYPRSYYKCTHPNCFVKKKVERSLDGQIAEIVYKGEHNHVKPQPTKRNPSMPGIGTATDGNGQDRNEGSEGRIENQIEVCKAPAIDPVASDNSCGVSGECEDGSKALDVSVEDKEPKSKQRKNDVQLNEAVLLSEPAKEPQQNVKNPVDTEIIGHGFRWRKYGQKVVKGNPYPRSYYRCTGPKCNMRKYVERVSEDPGAFITTYEGKHNHEMPARGSNSEPPATRSKP